MGKPKAHRAKSKHSYSVKEPSLEETYPWVSALSQKDRGEFLMELLDEINEALFSGSLEKVRKTIEAWQETAEILADKELVEGIKQSEDEVSKGATIPCKEAKLGTK
jgi:predicted nucleotidyltransferase